MTGGGVCARRLVRWLVVSALAFVSLVCAADDFENGLESGTIASDAWQLDTEGACEIDVVADNKIEGKYAMRFDAAAHGRCEVVPRVYQTWFERYRNEPFGVERWYEFSTFFPAPWLPNERNEIIAQWHGNADKFLGDIGSRGPPLAIRIYGDKFRITSGADADLISRKAWVARNPLWIGPVVAGQWLKWRAQVRWSYKDDGLVRIWLNDEQIVDHAGPNTYNDLRGVYLKLGPYHPGLPRIMYLDDVVIGNKPSENPPR